MRIDPVAIFASAVTIGVVIYGYLMFSDKGVPEPGTMASILTNENAILPVYLTQEQRDEANRQCITAFNTQEFDGIRHFGKPGDIERELSRFATESCRCLIRQLEKKTTTFEFVLAMSMQFAFTSRSDYASFSGGSAKKRESVFPYAQSIGLTAKQFDAAGIKAQDAVMAAGDHCMKTNGG